MKIFSKTVSPFIRFSNAPLFQVNSVTDFYFNPVLFYIFFMTQCCNSGIKFRFFFHFIKQCTFLFLFQITHPTWQLGALSKREYNCWVIPYCSIFFLYFGLLCTVVHILFLLFLCKKCTNVQQFHSRELHFYNVILQKQYTL